MDQRIAANKVSILTPDPFRVEALMTIQPLTQKAERALGQAQVDFDVRPTLIFQSL